MGLFSKIFNAVTAPFRGIFHREKPQNLEEIPDNFEEAWEPEDYFVDELDRFESWDGHILPQYEDMIDEMVNNGHIGAFSSEDAEKEFLRFLGSDFWESKKQYIYTPEVMQQIQDAIENGAKVSDLTQAFYEFEAWQNEEADFEEFWQGWLQVED